MNREVIQELEALLFKNGDTGLTETERARLNAILSESPEARRVFAQEQLLDAALRLEGEAGLTGVDEPVEAIPDLTNVDGSRNRTAWWMGIAAAFVGALLVNAFVMALRDNAGGAEGVTRVEVANPVDGVAVLSRAVGVEWGDGAYREGDGLPKGLLSIRSGLAQIEFFGGATVIMEGPAELELVSASLARLKRGRLRAFVPEPAQGFRVDAPRFDAIDLGTEFAMSVGSNGESELHVVDGEVALHEKSGSLLQNLTAGTGLRSSQLDNFETIEANPNGFVGREQMVALTDARWLQQAASWRDSRALWRADTDTLCFFDFEGHQTWDRQLRSARTGGPGGAIVGAKWTQGRWPGKGALEFKRINDRVRIQVPGEFESLSLSTWVRIEGLDRWMSSLMLTDGWDEGEVHWQISDNGELILGISGMGNSFSRPVIGPESLGRWLHLATVYDGVRNTVVHYVDGIRVGETRYKNSVPLRIGQAEIGNWTAQGRDIPTQRIRSLNGRMDEFLVLKRALTAAEIQTLFNADTPHP